MNIIQDVAAIIKSISKVDIFINDGVNKTFKELEIDSLDLMNILLEVEEKFNISIPEDDLIKPNETVNMLIEQISKLIDS